MLNTLLLFAGDEANKTNQEGAPAFWPFLVLPIIMIVYFILMRRGSSQDRERQTLIGSLKKNDEVITTAGIYGKVISVSDDKDEVVVRVDDNVKLRMAKSSILRNLSGEEAAKAAKDQASSSAIKAKESK